MGWLIFLRTRMGGHVDALDLLESGMRIDLGGTQGGVAEECLDRTDIGSVIQHRRGESMAQDVR